MPNSNVNREQMAVMFYNLSKAYSVPFPDWNVNLSQYPDSSKISGWARTQIMWAVGNKIISGKSSNGKLYLDPKGEATRAEAAAIILNYEREGMKLPKKK